jgi:hypothetical protein
MQCTLEAAKYSTHRRTPSTHRTAAVHAGAKYSVLTALNAVYPNQKILSPCSSSRPLAMLVLCLPRACSRVPFPDYPNRDPLYDGRDTWLHPNGSLHTRYAARCARKYARARARACVARARVSEDMNYHDAVIPHRNRAGEAIDENRKTPRLQPASNFDRAQW